MFRVIVLSALVVTLSGCTPHRHLTAPSRECAADVIAALADEVPGDSAQLMAVLPLPAEASRGAVYLFDRGDGGWRLQRDPLPAMLGRNGFARPGEKREGDGRTPAGLFPVESAFGYDAAIDSNMPYRQATADDLWVDDVQAPDYNRWVRRGETAATSFEEMKRSDHRYRYGLVTGYNRQPVVPGLGSAIFIHVWLEEGVSTSGCVALSEADLAAILRWLDAGKKPMVLMGDPRHLRLFPRRSGSASPPASCPQDAS